MRFTFLLLGDDAAPMLPFTRDPSGANEAVIEAAHDELLAAVWARAAQVLGFGVEPSLNDTVDELVAFLRFAAPDDVGYDKRRQLMASDLEIVDADGRVTFARTLHDTTVADLRRTADAGLVDGDVARPYFIPQVAGGSFEWFVSWPTFVGGFVMVRGLLSVLSDVEGVVQLVRRLRTGAAAVAEAAPMLEACGARPDALYELLGRRPWAQADLAELLGCQAETAVALLELFGYEPDAGGLWRRGESRDARVLRAVLDEIITTGAHGAGSNGGGFEERIRHLLTTGERAQLPDHMKDYDALEPNRVDVADDAFDMNVEDDEFLPLDHMLLRCSCGRDGCRALLSFSRDESSGHARLTFTEPSTHFCLGPQLLSLVGAQLEGAR